MRDNLSAPFWGGVSAETPEVSPDHPGATGWRDPTSDKIKGINSIPSTIQSQLRLFLFGNSSKLEKQ